MVCGGRINSFIDIKFLKFNVLRINLIIYLESKYNIYQAKIIIKKWKNKNKNKLKNKKISKIKNKVKENKNYLKTLWKNNRKKKRFKRKVNNRDPFFF